MEQSNPKDYPFVIPPLRRNPSPNHHQLCVPQPFASQQGGKKTTPFLRHPRVVGDPDSRLHSVDNSPKCRQFHRIPAIRRIVRTYPPQEVGRVIQKESGGVDKLEQSNPKDYPFVIPPLGRNPSPLLPQTLRDPASNSRECETPPSPTTNFHAPELPTATPGITNPLPRHPERRPGPSPQKSKSKPKDYQIISQQLILKVPAEHKTTPSPKIGEGDSQGIGRG